MTEPDRPITTVILAGMDKVHLIARRTEEVLLRFADLGERCKPAMKWI